MCSCIWLAPPRLAFFLAICGVGHKLSIIIWFNKVVVVVVVVAMVTDSVTKIIPTCSPIVGELFDTMIVASIDK